MNEKIRELAEQAGIGFTLWDDSGREMIDNYTPEECLEKFTELIVRRVISVYNDSETFKTSVYDDNRVLDYFGIDK